MEASRKQLRELLAQLVLSLPSENFSSEFPGLLPVLTLLQGQYSKVLQSEDYLTLVFNDETREILGAYPGQGLVDVLKSFVETVSKNFRSKYGNDELAAFHLHLVAIALLQLFIQINFTGPALENNAREDFFPGVDDKLLHTEAIQVLSVTGQQAYELMEGPLYFIIAALIFEKLVGSEISLLQDDFNVAEITEYYGSLESVSTEEPVRASVQWWMARAVQVHTSLLSEPASVLSTVSSLLLNPSVANTLCPAVDGNVELQRNVQCAYFLECARSGIHSQTEYLSIPLLGKARKVSNFTFVLSGAKAKRTKFQKFHTSALIVLAKSETANLYSIKEGGQEVPESFELNSDLLLERPQFESLEDIEFTDDKDSGKKRIKLDLSLQSGEVYNEEIDDEEEKLLPIALRKENIPEELQNVDPNDQPGLSDLDNVQLLLRLATLRQTSPAGNALVEEELLALVSRVLYTTKDVNWAVFSRALWERSVLETTKARTIERGILQMTSLVEEMGIKIKTRMIPQVAEEEDKVILASASRLRFIHQLPLMPQWQMDSKLAEKFMSLGVFRSAVEIYERLGMVCEAALCYAAVGDDKEAENILIERINTHPRDARAISILGDVRQDPELWQKAWDVGKYYKAQGSLSHYYYSPPRESGIAKNVDLAIKHMNLCLSINPLSYENWFFYGCCGLETEQYDLSSEAFTRCVSLDDTNSHAWSNLATSLLRTDKVRPAFNALKKAIRCAGESKTTWRIYENYLVVAAKLNEWSDVLIAARELVNLRGNGSGEDSIDIPVVEKLVEILVATEFPTGDGAKMTFYQTSCVDFICNLLPTVITTSARAWRIVSRVEIWRRRPWSALECHEKAYRALSHRPELEHDETAWNEAVDACADLIAAYESLGELPGKHDADDLVCKDWKYKARSTVRSLMSKGKQMWEDSEGWEKLQEMKEELRN